MRIEYASYGLRFNAGSSAQVTNTTIRENNYGVYVLGDGTAANNPTPVVTGGAIYNNFNYNYYANTFGNPNSVVLDASNNYWGGTNFDAIHSKIYDHNDYGNSPWVEIGMVLDTGGDAYKQLLNAPITTDTTLLNGVTYSIGRDVPVASGVTLTVEAGARIEGHNSSGKLTINGTLSLQGTATDPVIFTSNQATPARGDWYGIEINSASAQNVITYAD